MPDTLAPPRSSTSPVRPHARTGRVSVAEYHRMIERGELTEDDRVELLDGEIVPKMPRNDPHLLTVEESYEQLRELAPHGWYVRQEYPITLSTSEPEPDVAVVRGSRRDYGARKPGPADVALVVEVADSSLRRDRRKRTIYAAAGLPEYWIVNLTDRVLERYTGPAGDRYTVERFFRLGEAVPVTIDGTVVGTIPVAELLPPG